MESAILLNNIIATLDETSEGSYPVGFLHRDMNVKNISNRITKMKNKFNFNSNSSPNSNESELFKNRLRELKELRNLHENREKRYLGGGVALTNPANVGPVKNSAFEFVGRSTGESTAESTDRFFVTHSDQIYDVKYSALTMYLLADLTLQGMLNFNAVNSIFMKYLHFETDLMEHHLHSKEYIYDSATGVIFPANFIQFTNSTRIVIDDALLASYRLMAISKILSIYAVRTSTKTGPYSGPVSVEDGVNVVDENMRGLIIKHMSYIHNILDAGLFDRSGESKNYVNTVKEWELRMFTLALDRITNVLSRFGFSIDSNPELSTTNELSSVDDESDLDTNDSKPFSFKDYSVKKLRSVLSKTPAVLDVIITGLNFVSSHREDNHISSYDSEDRSCMIPFALMTDDEMTSDRYSSNSYTKTVNTFLENCRTDIPIYIHATDAFMGLIGSNSHVDVVLTLLVYSRLYKIVTDMKPLVEVDKSTFIQIKQNIVYIINRFDSAFCKRKFFDVGYSNTEKTVFFRYCDTVPYLVPISLVYAIVSVVTTTVSNQSLLKDVNLNCGKDDDENFNNSGNSYNDVYPLIDSNANPLNYGTINKTGNKIGSDGRLPDDTILTVFKNTPVSTQYPRKFKNPFIRPFVNTTGINYPIENSNGVRNVSLDDIVSISKPTKDFSDSAQLNSAVCTTKYCTCRFSKDSESLDTALTDQILTKDKIDELDKSLEGKTVITIDDLILLGKTFNCQTRRSFKGVDLQKIADLVDPLTSFNDMKGLADVKQKIVNNVMYFLKKGKKQGQIWNIAIYGPPGVGKTTIAKHVANIYSKAGILSTNRVESVKRSDLVGKYLGETAIKTQEIINKIKGGILLIDEVYSLGHHEKRDSFSKECLDTLTHNLGQEDTDFICIVAGYEEDVKNCFFAQNKGLQRRFPFVYRVDEYDSKVMSELTLTKLRAEGWSVKDNDKEVVTKFINDNKDKFANFMGDIENFVLRLEILNNSESMFCETEKTLSVELLQKTLDDIVCAPKEKEKKTDDESWRHMYV
ncbi:AAA family ATPase [Yasminevirus sp. GU-2018]|uniref:AAA family ATPase n=1 Tax=Yasminevirus sp. GU-2018 TaxID=2420051 RepID=A0A5K0UA27_9VIRU|nr:AAA family ATPase [Yasminevirus sp. GU-2018]